MSKTAIAHCQEVTGIFNLVAASRKSGFCGLGDATFQPLEPEKVVALYDLLETSMNDRVLDEDVRRALWEAQQFLEIFDDEPHELPSPESVVIEEELDGDDEEPAFVKNPIRPRLLSEMQRGLYESLKPRFS